MNEDIEKMVEESCKLLPYRSSIEAREFLRTALTSAYNIGLERAKLAIIESAGDVSAIDREKITNTDTEWSQCNDCFDGDHNKCSGCECLHST